MILKNTSIIGANAPLIDRLLSLQITGGHQTTDESSFQRNNSESSESDPDFEKKNIAGKLIFTPDENNTITGGYIIHYKKETQSWNKSSFNKHKKLF